MREISSNRFAGIIEAHDVLLAAVRVIVRRLSFFAGSSVGNLLGRMNKSFFVSPTTSLVSRQEVTIMYFGRTSEFLMMTSELMVTPSGRYTLGQLLCSLYKRGDRWVEELDNSHLLCTVNGREGRLFDRIEPGAEICISSIKSIFEG